MRIRHAMMAALALVPFAAPAQVETVVTPLRGSPAVPQLGSRFRDELTLAARASAQGDHATARKRLAPVLGYCDRLRMPGREVVAVSDAGEYETYMKANATGTPVEWVDMACPNAYKMAAFLDIEESRSADGALAMLEKASAIAPYWSDPHVERGFLLNRLKRPAEALESYRQAQDLADRFASNRHIRAMILRGLGYTYIELGAFDRAEQAYRQSLEIEPGNELARRELEFIRQQRGGAD